MGIVPVYPPREDVQVGDIYLYLYDPEAQSTMKDFDRGDLRVGIEPRWNYLPVLQEIDAEYRTRPSWPATPDIYSQILNSTPTGTPPTNPPVVTPPTTGTPPATSSSIWQQPTSAAVFTNMSQANRLRVTAFPDFASATFTQGNLNALIPIEGLTSVLGAAGSKATQVSIKIPSAEAYAISSAVLLNRLVRPSIPGTFDTTCGIDLAAWYKSNKLSKHSLILVKPTCASGLSLTPELYNANIRTFSSSFTWVRVITEVFYARAIDIGVSTNKAGGITAAASVGVTPGNQSSTPLSAATQTDLVNQLNTALNSGQGGITPGGSLKFMGAHQNSIAMRRVFEHPVAIGFRGLTLMIHTQSGIVVAAAPNSSDLASKFKGTQ